MKIKSVFVCQQCGYESPSWYGKCPQCGTWNSLVETVKESGKAPASARTAARQAKPVKLSEVRHIEKSRIKSGFVEFDRVMGGGIVPGSVTLLAGDPGIGKSTMLLHVIARTGGLYVSGEESAEQVKLRAKRLGISGDNISILAETLAEAIAEAIHQPGAGDRGILVVDSVQTLNSEELEGMAGSVGQLRRSTEILVAVAKTTGIPVVIIGHVTKEGAIAGPKVLEHMVDTVLYLEGERYANARILRTLKNRYGAVDEVGLFEMGDGGLKEIENPSEIFLQDRVTDVPGSVVTVVLEGTRPLLIEIQALAVPSPLAVPRRVGSGVDYNRLQVICAIIQKRLGLPISSSDIYVNVSGGIRISEPAADLAIALSIISSYQNRPAPRKAAAFGEIGLLGEVRRTSQEKRRITEARRLGYATLIHSQSAPTLRSALSYLRKGEPSEKAPAGRR
ncbi:DNA repair protein RadA [Candidatus Gottesmanbacteria bacterium RBG_16_52_11]|uniref:DNA repair protein RadA n=1 Tax=Candidatus Gottesmanbacteria bacterium RBG_16_52_11 TaxID=1798374 RepID=A0A1F5YVS7_9BACT|nr:MAG: DNA repair protein RadA [Candidatus Gottesmanbacteria bacterium RBG_16_52_11]